MNIRPNQAREGPWLDRLFPVKLPDGRMCSVTGFSVVPAYDGVLEGGLDEPTNTRRREAIVALARRRFGDPVYVVEPTIEPLPDISTPSRPRVRLPWMACMAGLVSSPLDPDALRSALTLVFWADVFTTPLPLEIERAVSSVSWEREAEDQGGI
jgi:hypothetical protein